MALDPYSPCPCGSGKKIKFCDCGKDMLGDLERVMTLLDADQRVAALDQIKKLIETKGERAALLALEANAYLQAGDMEQARPVVEKFARIYPENPLALAEAAILKVADEDLEGAVHKLQEALEHIGNEIPLVVYESIGLVGQSLLAAGNILGARGHLLLQAGIGGAEDQRGLQMLMRLQTSPQVPLLLKQDFLIGDVPKNVPWGKEYGEALSYGSKGAWAAAANRLTGMADRFPKEPLLLRSAAIFRTYVGDTPATVAAWRRYAAHPGVTLDDAVEAEALAQLIDADAPEPEIDVLTIEYALQDAQVVMERLLSDKRIAASPSDPAELVEEGEPPPKGVFWLLDRPVPPTGVGLSREAVPCVLGELLLFGKQTDRSARLEFIVARTDDFAAKTKALTQLLFGLIGPAGKEEVVDKIPASQLSLTFNWRLPNDTPLEDRRRLIDEQRREMLLNVWPNTPSGALGGKRPAEVASDPAYRVRLLAAILRLEFGNPQDPRDYNLNDLRKKLGLPTRDPIDPAGVDMERLSLLRFPQLMVEKLSDDALLTAYKRAARNTSPRVTLPLVKEVVRRPQLASKTDLAEAHVILGSLTEDSAEAFAYAAKAREIAVGRGESAAPWLLDELSLHLVRQDLEGSQNLLKQIQTRYQKDANVMRALAQLLVRHGVISPDGTPAGPRPGAAAPAEPAAAPASKLWTPESAAAPAAAEGKSKLWIPGME
jgi:tetratricopeptide (TPR) repeat protein